MKTLIKQGRIFNEGKDFYGDILIEDGFISQIGTNIGAEATREIDAEGMYVLPGVIDDQVHFREPGMTHKATIESEARAAVVGGVTSFMEMPNTIPQALSQEELQKKYDIAEACSLGNYSFYMGASNDNIDEVLKTDKKNVCGLKVFMGSSTGNMLVDNEQMLENIFSQVDMLIATHCENEPMIRANMQKYTEQYGNNIPINMHPIIRDEEVCISSSKQAIRLAKKHNARLHILHISTEEETELFSNSIPLSQKTITSEVCVHHLHFTATDYDTLGVKIKCNPAIKNQRHKNGLWKALLDDRLDVIATDHAPHTWQEKMQAYTRCPSGVPLVQHPLLIMMEYVQLGKISVHKVVEKMCHAPAEIFNIDRRGYLREGYWADIVLVNPNTFLKVNKENLHYKCKWSPFEDTVFSSVIDTTIVSGHIAYTKGKIDDLKKGQRMEFNR